MIQCENCREKFYSPEEHHSLTGCQRKTIAGLRADVARERERADAAELALAELRATGDDMTRAIWRLLGLMEIDNHDAQMNAYLDAREPFQRWREVLYATPAPERGRALLAAGHALAEAVEALLVGGIEMKTAPDGPVTFEAMLMLIQMLGATRDQWRALVGEQEPR